MKLPGTIKIGQMKYKLMQMDGDANWGTHSFGKARICIADEIAEEALPFALWHEVIHAILLQAGYRKHLIGDEEYELVEKLVAILPFGVVQVLRDNPVLRGL